MGRSVMVYPLQEANFQLEPLGFEGESVQPLAWHEPELLGSPKLPAHKAYEAVVENEPFSEEELAAIHARVEAGVAAETVLQEQGVHRMAGYDKVYKDQVADGIQARKALIVGHLQLAVDIAKVDIAKSSGWNVDREEMVALANLALAEFVLDEYTPGASTKPFQDQAAEAIMRRMLGYNPRYQGMTLFQLEQRQVSTTPPAPEVATMVATTSQPQPGSLVLVREAGDVDVIEMLDKEENEPENEPSAIDVKTEWSQDVAEQEIAELIASTPWGSFEERRWMASEPLCRSVEDTSVFYPVSEKDPRIEIAKKICQACPVLEQCFEYVVTHPDREAIWGGITPEENRAIRAKRGVSRSNASLQES